MVPTGDAAGREGRESGGELLRRRFRGAGLLYLPSLSFFLKIISSFAYLFLLVLGVQENILLGHSPPLYSDNPIGLFPIDACQSCCYAIDCIPCAGVSLLLPQASRARASVY